MAKLAAEIRADFEGRFDRKSDPDLDIESDSEFDLKSDLLMSLAISYIKSSTPTVITAKTVASKPKTGQLGTAAMVASLKGSKHGLRDLKKLQDSYKKNQAVLVK